MNTTSYGLLPGDFIPITWISTLPLLLPYDVVRYIYHVIIVCTTMFMIPKCMMTINGLVYMKYIKHTQLIIRLMHLIIVGVSTWNFICYKYTWNELIITTWNYQMLVALLLVSCNWKDMVINALEINQINVIFYWVSEYKSRYYQ